MARCCRATDLKSSQNYSDDSPFNFPSEGFVNSVCDSISSLDVEVYCADLTVKRRA